MKLGLIGKTPSNTVATECLFLFRKNKIKRVSEDPVKYSYDKVLKFELIDTIDKYRTFADEKELELAPDIIYNKLWTNWYEFLGVDTSIFPQTKEEWKQICIENNLNDLTYYEKCYELNLPLMPSEMYKGNYSNIIAELNNNEDEDYGDNI